MRGSMGYRAAVGVCRPHPQRREAGLLAGLADDDPQALITARPFGGTLVAKGVTIPWKDSVPHFLLSHCFYDGGGVLSGPPAISVFFMDLAEI